MPVRSAITVFFSLVMFLSLSACNTVAGLGKDVEKGGEVLQKAATKP